MIEASPVKFYLAKFFFLAFSMIQWLAAAILLIQFSFTSKNFFIALVFITLGMVSFYLFLLVNDKVKRVAVGKNKIVIIPFFNLYKLKLRGKKNPVYFFPAKNIDPAFGLMARDTSRMGAIVEKKKKELGIE